MIPFRKPDSIVPTGDSLIIVRKPTLNPIGVEEIDIYVLQTFIVQMIFFGMSQGCHGENEQMV